MSAHATVARFLATRFRSTLGGREPRPDEPLLSSGVVDSFGLLELIAFVEDSFGVRIDPARLGLERLDTVDRIVALVESLGGGPTVP